MAVGVAVTAAFGVGVVDAVFVAVGAGSGVDDVQPVSAAATVSAAVVAMMRRRMVIPPGGCWPFTEECLDRADPDRCGGGYFPRIVS
jgi:hypothetical protein